jgi:hypothetical protein
MIDEPEACASDLDQLAYLYVHVFHLDTESKQSFCASTTILSLDEQQGGRELEGEEGASH